ncbi:MAG TPA: UvrD-helicase domain-containing protein [Proteiniphilum sp.]|nr:UvrD-helicase domain-containing protein [Proteiniphilum sp.]HPD85978.1 UvrD-helicase domain-containing protein [Proteiniphilum sp.]HPJ50426.1 UvrD-helicase domain-containing protein [Proteiniphilum sp.]HPR19778.1 UvrD-helicase domain-containing protein [Proteiniphilum sp.]
MPRHASYERELLHLIKASAGSGKTHRLTGEYLRLLFSRPNNHSHILAVTFTNKATEEMKSRIVEELYHLSAGEPSGYLEDLMQEFSMNEKSLRALARSILETILHDYSAFNISTIDRFFQRTMRAFTREIGLAGGYNIEVEESAMLIEAVDLMLSELDKPENKSLSDWLLRFMQDSIEEGGKWKIESQVYKLAGELSNETYKSLTPEEFAMIRDKKFLEEYRQMLLRIIKHYEAEVREAGALAVAIMQKEGLEPSEFIGGSKSQFFKLTKMAQGELPKLTPTFLSFPDQPERWSAKNCKPERVSKIEAAYHNGLNETIKNVIRLYKENIAYNTAKAILQNFYTLGILSDIKNRLRNLQQENNTLFLSDTTELLNQIIAGADAPFIFEKTGTLLSHYMIDEFQDTSRMQWKNFMPLIRESLASGNFNLIVGDVKQSIYRWRNSDWRLLEETVEVDLHGENIRNHLLDTNWRSDTHVIRFNNAFFTTAATILQEEVNNLIREGSEANTDATPNRQIIDAYAEVYQEQPPHKLGSGGQVKVQFLNNDEDQKWKEKALEQLPGEVDKLREQGFELKDIAILVRTNKEAAEVAERLLAYAEQHPESPYRYDIISNEALQIGKAQAVKAVIAMMRHFQHPNDNTRRMMAHYEYLRFHERTTPEEAIRSYTEETNGEFPDELQARFKELATLPLYEMIESFFALSVDAIDEMENAHVQAFLDIALRFGTSRSSDLNSFLEWWDEKGHEKALFSPDSQDAIRLITIHKSKGLGFGAVIMPFLSWNTDHSANSTNIIWCKPKVAPFDRLRIAPLKYEKRLTETIFRGEYLEERLFTYIDNLNMLYVAFTRAKHRLIAFAPQPGKSESISDVATLLWRCINEDPLPSDEKREQVQLRDYFSADEQTLLYGDATPFSKKGIHPVAVTKTGKWQSIPVEDRLQLRLNGIGYFSDDGSRDYGKLMHAIVSDVVTLSDLPLAVDKKVSEGELSEADRDETLRKLQAMLSLPEVADWFDGRYTVLNETQLLHPQWGFRRPDRVMIGNGEVIVADYKFGELEDLKHIRQVQHYLQTIRQMGFGNVKGYLFYMKTGHLLPV